MDNLSKVGFFLNYQAIDSKIKKKYSQFTTLFLIFGNFFSTGSALCYIQFQNAEERPQ